MSSKCLLCPEKATVFRMVDRAGKLSLIDVRFCAKCAADPKRLAKVGRILKESVCPNCGGTGRLLQ